MSNPQRRYDAVVIVASLGGISALTTVLSALPRDFPIPVFVVQHRSTAKPSMLAAILGRSTKMDVKSAEAGEIPAGGCVYVAPPDHHLIIEAPHRLALTDGRRIRHLRSAGDPLFTSAAATFGRRVIAVVLTGTDSDGAQGVVDIKHAGGTVIVQDRESSESFAMPQAAIATGCVDEVLPVGRIGHELVRLTRNVVHVMKENAV